MLDADELAEMRALHARAYGRDAHLSDVDAARLRELEGRRVIGALTERAAETRDAHGQVPSAGSGRQAAEASGVDGTAETPVPWVPELVEGSVLSRIPSLWRPIAIAAAAALVVGIGLGWFLFGRPIQHTVALTPEQQEWQSALLADGVYDSGSVRAVAVEKDVVVWTATKDGRKSTCLILGSGDEPQPSCGPTETVDDEGLWASLILEISDEVRREVVASVLFAPSGEPVVRVDVMDQTPGTSSITYANETETSSAAQLAEDGFDPNSIWVAGYDGDVPIWTATQLASQAQCLIYDGSAPSSPRVCADPQTMTEQDSGLVLNVVDTETGETTTFEMSSNYGPSYLVITRERGEIGAGGD